MQSHFARNVRVQSGLINIPAIFDKKYQSNKFVDDFRPNQSRFGPRAREEQLVEGGSYYRHRGLHWKTDLYLCIFSTL